MPDEYRAERAALRRDARQQRADGRAAGARVDHARPTLKRKLALTAKVQDEVGHAQLLYRVAEDLGKSREAMLRTCWTARPSSTTSSTTPPIVGRRGDHRLAGGRRRNRRRRRCSTPATALRPHDAEDLLGGVVPHQAWLRWCDAGERHAAQRSLLQEALERWWAPLMQMHDPERCRRDAGRVRYRRDRRAREAQSTLAHARTLDRRGRGACSAGRPRSDGGGRSGGSDRPRRCAARRIARRQRALPLWRQRVALLEDLAAIRGNAFASPKTGPRECDARIAQSTQLN